MATIPGYNMLRSPPGTNGKSRVLAYVKDAISITVLRTTPMEIWITIHSSTSPLTIAGVYRQWQDNERLAMENFYSNCADALKFSRILILGDFNLDVTRINDCSYSRAAMAANLEESMESMGYFFAGPNSPTYFSHGFYNGSKRTSTIDLVYARGLAASVVALDYVVTDHRPVLATVPSTKAAPSTNKGQFVRNLRGVSAVAFCSAIDAHLPNDFFQAVDVDAAHATLVAAVTAALDELAPLRLAKPKQASGFNLSLAPDTLEVIRQRDATSPTRPLFRVLRNRASKLVRRDAVFGAMRAIDANEDNPKKLWDFAKKQMGYVCPSLPACLSASDINNYFVEKIRKIRQGIPEATTTRFSTKISKARFQFKYPSAGKAREMIRSLGNTGALGIDGIGVAALKLGADAIAAPLAHIARLSFMKGVFPTGFKTAVVTPVYKGRGKPPLDVSSYRPISILPAMSKVIERLVMEPLATHLAELLPNSQFGFRAKRSTLAAIATAHGAWSKAKTMGKIVAVAA